MITTNSTALLNSSPDGAPELIVLSVCTEEVATVVCTPLRTVVVVCLWVVSISVVSMGVVCAMVTFVFTSFTVVNECEDPCEVSDVKFSLFVKLYIS
jgi:hypothetical protein